MYYNSGKPQKDLSEFFIQEDKAYEPIRIPVPWENTDIFRNASLGSAVCQAGESACGGRKQLNNISPEAEALLSRYQDLQGEHDSLMMYQEFSVGFRVGAQLMAEMLQKLE